MGFLDDMIAKGKNLLGKVRVPKAPDAINTDAVIHDSWDRQDWEWLRRDVSAIDNNIDELALKHDYVEDFFEDFYNLLHQGDPMIRDRDDVNERYQPNVDLAQQFRDMSELKSLRLSTMHDQFATAMAMVSMQSALKSAYERGEEARQAAKDAAEKREQLRELMSQLAEAVAKAGQMDQDDPQAEELAAEIESLMGEVEQLSGESAEMDASAAQASQQAAEGAEMAVRSAARQASNQAQEEQELARAFGLEDGQLQKMDFEERKRLSKALRNNRLAQFAKILGQFRNIEAGEARRKITHAPDEVVGVELGDNLTRLTSGEMLNLAEPLLEDDFWRRMADHELVVYKLEGREKVGKGPVIVVCDESGSMMSMVGDPAAGMENNTCEAWSKALALALCERARRDGRDFHYIGFSSSQQQFHMEFPGGKAPIEKVIQFTEHFFSGGTYYEAPLRQAMEIVQKYAADKKPKPDIVFITDDCYYGLSEEFITEWNAVKHEVEMRCFGILIGTGGGESSALNAVSDDVRTIDGMTSDPNNTRDLFRTV